MCCAVTILSGLKPQLKSKLAGQEGTFDQLLVRPHFEEAQLLDFEVQMKKMLKLKKEVQEQEQEQEPTEGQSVR